MPRTIVIRIVVDNRDAVNAIKAQREEDGKLRDSLKFTSEELRKQELHAKRLADTGGVLNKSNESLATSFTKGFIAARVLSEAYSVLTSSVGYLIGESAKLELSLAKVAAVTGDSGDAVSSLRNTIFVLGETTSSSIDDISKAGLELSKLGFAGKDLEVALSGVARLSSILGDSLETTGNLVGGVIQVFDLAGADAAKVADKLFVATGKSATNIEGFRIAFALAGNVAHDAGITFEQLSAAIASLSNQGIRASTIGTGLRNFIGELSKEGSKAQKALGGSIEELGLVGAMEKLAALKLPPGSLIEIFGKPGAPVASGLSHAKDEYEKFISSIQNSDGILLKSGEIINDTLIGSIQRLKNNLVELFATSTSPAADALKSTVGFLAEKLAGVNEHKRKIAEAQGFDVNMLQKGLNPASVLGLDKFFDYTDSAEKLDIFIKKIHEYEEAAAKGKEESDAFSGSISKAVQGIGQSAFTKDKAPNVKQVLSKEDLVAQIDEINLAFERFKAGQDKDFDFSKSENALLGLAKALDALKDKKGGLKAYAEYIELKREEKRINDSAEKDRTDRIKFDIGIEKTVDNIGKAFATPKKSKKDIEAAKSDEQKYQDYLKKTNDEIDTYNTKLNTTKMSFDVLSDSVNIFADSLANVFVGEGLNSFDNFGENFKKLAQNFIAQIIAMEIRLLAFKLALRLFGFIAGGAAGAAAGDVAGGVAGQAAAQNFDAVYGPATQAGDAISQNGLDSFGSGVNDRVATSALGKKSSDSNSGGVTIVVQGDVYNAEKLVDKIAQTNERSRTRYV